jgi:hypothetical protein
MMVNKRLFRVETYKFVAGMIVNKDNIIIDAAPILHKFIGCHVADLYTVYCTVKIEELPWEDKCLEQKKK